ncbi:MAG: replication factor C small subunit [Candidatus Aenigmatarchaeota archaeon]
MTLAEEIWTEKHRPKRLAEMTGQKNIIDRLEAFVKSRSLPHCLFTGPAGCGKTTAALCIATELFGNNWKSNFLELNASDERGIDTIRVKVKDFARTMPLEGLFKIIYLDEADSLTSDAQHALRRTMERYASIARFILSCNYSNKIIPPIQSRTAVFRFSQLTKDDVEKSLKSIAKKEGVVVDQSALDAIVYLAEGDMRKAINILQTASILKKKIDEETIYSVTSKADPLAVKKMLMLAVEGRFKEARTQLLVLLLERGIAGEDIIKEIHNQILNFEISDEKKIQLIEKVGEYEFRLTEGSNPRIQLEALLAQIGLISKK